MGPPAGGWVATGVIVAEALPDAGGGTLLLG
jgi:hypothetical protein